MPGVRSAALRAVSHNLDLKPTKGADMHLTNHILISLVDGGMKLKDIAKAYDVTDRRLQQRLAKLEAEGKMKPRKKNLGRAKPRLKARNAEPFTAPNGCTVTVGSGDEATALAFRNVLAQQLGVRLTNVSSASHQRLTKRGRCDA